MKIDPVVTKKSLEQKVREIIDMLNGRLTLLDNFLPEGTDGQVATSQGLSTPPTWEDVPSGGGVPGAHTHTAGDIVSGRLDTDRMPTGVAYADQPNTFKQLNLFEAGIASDTVAEVTVDAGVTVDGLLIKDAGIPEAAVTAHQAALAITESQISGLDYYTHADLVNAMRFSAYRFQAQIDSITWRFDGAGLTPDGALSGYYFCPIVLPVGVTIQTLRVRGKRTNAGDVFSLVLQRANASGTISAVATQTWTDTSGSFREQETTGLSTAVVGTYTYFLTWSATNVAAVWNVALMWVELDVVMT